MKNSGLSGYYERMSLHVFVGLVHFTFHGEEVLKLGGNRRHWDPIFTSAIPDQNRRTGDKDASFVPHEEAGNHEV